MLTLLTKWLDKRGSSRMIRRIDQDTGFEADYLKRFYILRTRWVSVFIHQFWMSDPDHAHDHPWDNITFILRGGYHETSADGTSVWRKRGYFRFRSGEVFHRLAIGPHSAGQGWTLFIHGRKKRKWGFLTPEGWLEASEYGIKYNSPVETPEKDYKLTGVFFPKVTRL